MRILLLALLIVLAGNVYSQVNPDKVANALDTFALLHPQEKVFLHSDRDAFAVGQTIWFKGYITVDGKPTNLSKVLYVELVNSQGQLVTKRMIRAENGSGHGEILLKDSLLSGTYTLNAYTLWMLNFPGFIFKKHITVHNPSGKTGRTNTSSVFDMQFMPEGGRLVAGLESRVAFKAVGATGMPLSVTGRVMDSKKNVVASLTTTHDGMGVFSFTPQLNELYTASVTASGERSAQFNLPTALTEGVVLSVNNDNPNRIFVAVNRSETNKAKYNELLLVAQTNYEVIFTGKIDFDAGMTGLPISKKDLPPGILQITLMNMQGLPVAERLVFVNNLTPPNTAQLRLDTVNTAQRKHNLYTVDLTGYSNMDASVAVVNADAAVGNESENIASSILLTSDIKGYVHNPGYYFANKDTSTTKALDLLLMTQGWRRFNWEKVVKNEHPALKFPFETGIWVRGKLTGADGKKGVANGKLELITKAEDSTTILTSATVNDKNEFAVFDLDFRKEAMVYYQGTNMSRQGAIVNVSIYPSYFDTAKNAKGVQEFDKYTEFAVNDYWKGLEADKIRVDSAIGKTLAAVTVTGRRRSVVDSLNKVYATDLFFNSDQTITFEDVHLNDIWQYLNRQVPGISIINTDTGKHVYFTRYAGLDAFSEAGGSSVAFFLNEVPVSVDIIDAIHPDDVGMVKIYKGVTGIMLGADRGAIAVYTKKGGGFRDWRKKGFSSFRLSGYSVAREFYHPGPKEDANIPDIRPTLYWNPNLKSADGKAVIDFYNDDVARKFKVVIQGIDKNGKLLYIERSVQ